MHFSTDSQHRNALLIGGVVALLIAWAIWRGPDPTPRPAFHYPEPTPFVVETTRIEVFSNNRFCVGSFASC